MRRVGLLHCTGAETGGEDTGNLIGRHRSSAGRQGMHVARHSFCPCSPGQYLCVQRGWEDPLVQHLAQQLQSSLDDQLALILKAADGCTYTAQHSTPQLNQKHNGMAHLTDANT